MNSMPLMVQNKKGERNVLLFISYIFDNQLAGLL